VTVKLPLRVLFVEDSPDDAELIARELGRYGYEVRWERCDSDAALSEVVIADFDVVSHSSSRHPSTVHSSSGVSQPRGKPVTSASVTGRRARW